MLRDVLKNLEGKFTNAYLLAVGAKRLRMTVARTTRAAIPEVVVTWARTRVDISLGHLVPLYTWHFHVSQVVSPNTAVNRTYLSYNICTLWCWWHSRWRMRIEQVRYLGRVTCIFGDMYAKCSERWTLWIICTFWCWWHSSWRIMKNEQVWYLGM